MRQLQPTEAVIISGELSSKTLGSYGAAPLKVYEQRQRRTEIVTPAWLSWEGEAVGQPFRHSPVPVDIECATAFTSVRIAKLDGTQSSKLTHRLEAVDVMSIAVGDGTLC